MKRALSRRCNSCRFAEPSKFDEEGELSEGKFLLCNRFPPKRTHPAQNKYTFVRLDDWCGEFRFRWGQRL